MSIINASAQNTFTPSQNAVEYDIFCPDAYGTIIRGNRYFDNRLRNQYWTTSSNEDKKRALLESTSIIDTLNFAGQKLDPNQFHQFPRETYPANFPNVIKSNLDLIVPRDIEMACYEIAIQLLSGIDPDLEVENLGVHVQGFAQARTTYMREYVLDHIAAGVPSFKAWTLLKPYLRDQRRLNLSRVN